MPSAVLSFFAVLMISVTLALADATPLPVTWVETRDTPLTLENALSAADKEGTWVRDFVTPFSLEPTPYPTAICFLADGNALHLLVKAQEPSGQLVTKVTERNGAAFRDDSIEFFIRANKDEASYLQIISNAIGAVSERAYAQGGFVTLRDWRGNTSAQTRKTETGWELLLSIPHASLKIDPAMNQWYVQVARNRPARTGKNYETATWPPAPKGLQTPSTFGPIELPTRFERARYGWAIIPGESFISRGKSGFQLERKLKITNQTGRYRTLEVRSVVGEASGSLGFGLADGSTREVTAQIPLGGQDRIAEMVEHFITLPDAPGETLAYANAALNLEYSPARVVLDVPGYRSAIFESQKVKTVEARLLQQDLLTPITEVAVRLEGPGGTSLSGTVTPTEGEEDAWDLKVEGIDSLAVGDYQLKVAFSTPNGPVELSRRIRKLPYRKGETWINRRGLILREGRPQPIYGFLFGYWARFSRERILPGMFFNFASPVRVRPPFRDLKPLVGRLSENGLLMAVDIPSASRTGFTRSLRNTPLTPTERKEYERIIGTVGDDPRVLAWYLFDEPEIHGLGAQRLREIYEIFRENDPWRPVIVLNAFVDATRDYQYGADISNPDPYPLFLEGRGAAKTLDYIGRFLDQIRTGEDSFRARWVTPQAFDYARYGREGNRGPTANEMRTQQVIALIHGATGFTWYPEYLAWDEPGVTASLPFLSREYEALFPHLVEAAPEILPTSDGLEAGLIRTQGEAALLLANPFWETREFAVESPLLARFTQWNGLGSPESLTSKGGKLVVTLQPHQSLILGTPGFPYPEKLKWAAVEEQERTMLQERIVPGNIAHLSTGALVRLADGSRSASLPVLLDGMKSPYGNGWRYLKFKSGIGIEIEFPTDRQPRRLRVFASNLKAASVEIEKEGQWLPKATLAGNGEVLEAGWEAETTRKVRLVVESVKESGTILNIGEIEVYE
ncbi:MAG TPA: hypothetical protein VNQ90_03885 [Chthoniobacteraceae bacterium]|nr:hypothetical protein [Chthoniobacteraceae bacterium]